ncbi:MAG TPA: hypothetical protein VGP08_00130 [Pyrinomonadaceae bacterium]|nr:hypothetical protein [Pyrinomonadaceae bacterium]
MALKIAWEAIQTELNGGLKTAVAVFFIAWTFFAIAIYISSWWEKRRGLAICVGIVVFVGLGFTWWAYLPTPPRAEMAVENNAESRPTPEIHATPVLDISVTLNKQLQIENKGNAAISNVRLQATEYEFDLQAWEQRQLKISNYQRVGGPLFHVDSIKAGDARTTDLTKLSPFLSFIDLSKGSASPGKVPGERKFYCLRITFRDERTGAEYATYITTGSVNWRPAVFEAVEHQTLSGPSGFDFELKIPSVLAAHNKELGWDDGAKDYNTP